MYFILGNWASSIAWIHKELDAKLSGTRQFGSGLIENFPLFHTQEILKGAAAVQLVLLCCG